MFCSECGEKNAADSKFCQKCGTALHKPESSEPRGRVSEEDYIRAMPDEERVTALLERAYRSKASGDPKAAIAFCNEAILVQPLSASAYSLLGQLYSAEGEHEAAITAYEKALQLNPGDIADRMKLDELRGGSLPVRAAALPPMVGSMDSPRNSFPAIFTGLMAAAVVLLGAIFITLWRNSKTPTTVATNTPVQTANSGLNDIRSLPASSDTKLLANPLTSSNEPYGFFPSGGNGQEREQAQQSQSRYNSNAFMNNAAGGTQPAVSNTTPRVPASSSARNPVIAESLVGQVELRRKRRCEGSRARRGRRHHADDRRQRQHQNRSGGDSRLQDDQAFRRRQPFGGLSGKFRRSSAQWFELQRFEIGASHRGRLAAQGRLR